MITIEWSYLYNWRSHVFWMCVPILTPAAGFVLFLAFRWLSCRFRVFVWELTGRLEVYILHLLIWIFGLVDICRTDRSGFIWCCGWVKSLQVWRSSEKSIISFWIFLSLSDFSFEKPNLVFHHQKSQHSPVCCCSWRASFLSRARCRLSSMSLCCSSVREGTAGAGVEWTTTGRSSGRPGPLNGSGLPKMCDSGASSSSPKQNGYFSY